MFLFVAQVKKIFHDIAALCNRSLTEDVHDINMRTSFFALFCFLAIAVGAVEIRIKRDVPAPMRDGTILRADIYEPVSGGPYPVLVSRTPYGKHGHKFEEYAQAGYIVVSQDARGRYKSDGEFESFVRFKTH